MGLALSALEQRVQALNRTGEVGLRPGVQKRRAVAGGSLEHPHCRAVGLPLVAPAVSEELQTSRAYYDAGGGCLHCAVGEHRCSPASCGRWKKARAFSAIARSFPGFPTG